jgi:hypothetical protein
MYLKIIMILALGFAASCTDSSSNNDNHSKEALEETEVSDTDSSSQDDDSAVDSDDDDSAVDSDDDDSAVDSDDDDSGDDSSSTMHGGNPAPVTWTDCDQWPGSHPCDFSLTDQYGDTFTLYDNYDTVMVLDFSTIWCGVCKNIAGDVQAHQDAYGPQGFLWVTVLIEDAQGDDPDETDIQEWATNYGIIDSPVLAGNRADFVDLTGMSGYPITAWPTLVVIDRGMVLTNGLNGWNEDTIFGWVEDAL